MEYVENAVILVLHVQIQEIAFLVILGIYIKEVVLILVLLLLSLMQLSTPVKIVQQTALNVQLLLVLVVQMECLLMEFAQVIV